MRAINCIGLAGFLLIPNMSQALDWSQDWSDWEVRPRISTGLMQYQYKQQSVVNLELDPSQGAGGAFDEVEVGDTLYFAELGASLFLGNFFVDVSYQKSDKGDDSFTQSAFSGASNSDDESSAFLGISLDTDRTIERQEFSVSLGYALSENVGIFAGYKRNNTDFDDDIDSGLAMIGAAAPGRFDGGVFVTEVTGFASSEFEQDGFFLGATYVVPVETNGWLNGALSFDFGIAFLSGDLAIKDQATVTNDDIEFSETNATRQDANGDALGINLGVAWGGALTDRLRYTVGVDGYQYDYEGDSNSSDFEDTLLRFSIGVSYALDSSVFR